MSEYLVAVILGLVEGFTEFIPVSSTGHLILAGSLLGYTGEKAATFQVVIQLGAILAVAFLYRERLLVLLPFEPAVKPVDRFSGARGLTLLALTTLPSLVVGALTHDLIKTHLFTPTTVVWALAVGGGAILLVEGRPKTNGLDGLGAITWRQALVVGLFQCIAMWPGVSRSAATIVGGMLSGLSRRTAVEYSFLAAVPVMIAATTYDLYRAQSALDDGDLAMLAIGFVVAFLAAILAVKTFIRLLGAWTLTPFAWYRIGLAVVVFWLMV